MAGATGLLGRCRWAGIIGDIRLFRIRLLLLHGLLSQPLNLKAFALKLEFHPLLLQQCLLVHSIHLKSLLLHLELEPLAFVVDFVAAEILEIITPLHDTCEKETDKG